MERGHTRVGGRSRRGPFQRDWREPAVDFSGDETPGGGSPAVVFLRWAGAVKVALQSSVVLNRSHQSSPVLKPRAFCLLQVRGGGPGPWTSCEVSVVGVGGLRRGGCKIWKDQAQ